MDLINSRETIRFSESCRLCLRQPGIYNVFKIKGLLLDINEFTGVKVFLAGDLPQMICRECSAVIQRIKRLKEIATINDSHMRSLVIDKLEPSQQIEQVFVDEETESSDFNISFNEADDDFIIKTEEVFDHKSDSNIEAPCTSQVAVRSDLFSSAENELPMITETISLRSTPGLRIDDQFPIKVPETTYRCLICEKDFTIWRKFYSHNRSHNKMYMCVLDECKKKFATKGDLEKHSRTHTGEKPYQCDICCRRFSQKGSLKGHRSTVHKLTTELIIGP